jgi:hypothetical protein
MMKDQRSESLDRLSEHVSKVATDAIASAINTNAIINAITAGLNKARLTNELAMDASIIGEKIGESVAAAIKSAMADSEPKPSMDATTMREQTLGSLAHHSSFHACQLTEHNSQHSGHLRLVRKACVNHHSPSIPDCHQIRRPRRLLGLCGSFTDPGLLGQCDVHSEPRMGVVRGSRGIFRHLELLVSAGQ